MKQNEGVQDARYHSGRTSYGPLKDRYGSRFVWTLHKNGSYM